MTTPSSYTTWHIKMPLACLMCSRTAAVAQGPAGAWAKAVSVNPDHQDAVSERRCPWCGGRLLFGAAEHVRVLHRVPADVTGRQKPGRKPKTYACVDCGKTREQKSRHPRCRTCADAHRRAAGPIDRIVSMLASANGKLTSPEIAAALGISPTVTRAHIARAKTRGVPIVTAGRGYRLEVAS